MSDKPKYDVAISFLADDEMTARAIADRLEEGGLKVFFFPRNQEELAGTNGMESMRVPFFDSRVAIVLFKKPWGETPWTGVESTAIQERCLEQGWDSLLFVQLDKTSALPKWLPKTHVRFAFQDYGLEQLLGAIKLRVSEHGGEIRPPDAMSEARRIKRQADYVSARDAMMSDRSWIEGTVHSALRNTFQEVLRLVEQARKEHGLEITAAAQGYQSCVMRFGSVSLAVGWDQPIFNRVDDTDFGDCALRVREFSGVVPLPGEQGWFFEKPRMIIEHRFKVGVSEGLDLVWREQGKGAVIRADELPNRLLLILMDLISRDQRGIIQRVER